MVKIMEFFQENASQKKIDFEKQVSECLDCRRKQCAVLTREGVNPIPGALYWEEDVWLLVLFAEKDVFRAPN